MLLGDPLPGDEIWVAEGTYYPDEGTGQTDGNRESTFQLVEGVMVYGGFPADASATQLSDRNVAANPTILSGDLDQDDDTAGDNSENAYHVLTGNSLTAATIFDGFTITAGNADGSSPHNTGGGIANVRASPALANCTFSANEANYGGGMYNIGDSSPTLTDCTFSANSAGISGAGIFNSGCRPPPSPAAPSPAITPSTAAVG